MVELNITLVIQIVNFIVALIVLNFLLIGPVRAIIRRRKEMTEAMSRDIGRFAEESALRLKRYEAEMESVRAQAAVQRENARAQAAETSRSILENAQEEAAQFLQRSRKEADQEVATLRLGLSARVNALAGKVVSRVLA